MATGLRAGMNAWHARRAVSANPGLSLSPAEFIAKSRQGYSNPPSRLIDTCRESTLSARSEH